MHSMRWSKVLRPRSEKGLGLGCLRLKNWACYLNAGGSLRMQVTIQKKKKRFEEEGGVVEKTIVFEYGEDKWV